ncbi:MAG: hypothetical protein A2066_00825 [Bacteroidetes bacterium GWB2_41_8]|nr:MAG: hypothetical protein A2066_00825 [Bacteroidetes bacterium GWB2_41_8]
MENFNDTNVFKIPYEELNKIYFFISIFIFNFDQGIEIMTSLIIKSNPSGSGKYFIYFPLFCISILIKHLYFYFTI